MNPGGRIANPPPAGGYKLLAVDLDGTLLAHDGQPHAHDVAAMKALAKTGVVVTIATGRLPSGTLWVAEKAGITGPVVCADGSLLVDAPSGAILKHRTIGCTAHLRQVLPQRELAAVLFAGDRIVHDARATPYLPFFKTWSPDLHVTESLVDHPEFSDGTLTALVGIGPEAEVRAFLAEAEAHRESPVQVASFALRKLGGRDGMWGFLLRTAGPTKATGLEDLGERTGGIGLHEMVVVGDWMNDIPMLSVAGRGVAMGQAPAEVQAVATDLVHPTSTEGGGIAAAIAAIFGVHA